MNEFVIGKIMELSEKMAKIEALYLSLVESDEEIKKQITSQSDMMKEMGGLMMDVREAVAFVKGRTEKGDVNVNVDSKTNVDGANNVTNETNIS